MAATPTVPSVGLLNLNLERELVCFICTEILYQPLTLIDCLHSCCGSCLKEWFSHQHRKALSSHSASTTSSPYTCPACRAPVKDARSDAKVNTWVDIFLTANPDRSRSDEEKREIAQAYKPGDNILPKVEKRRERRTRRDEDALEARERRMVEEARERSLRDLRGSHTTTTDSLQPPASLRDGQASRSRDREERRERRREQERRDRRHRESGVEREGRRQESVNVEQQRRESIVVTPPATSPRHPEAVEARQRQQTVVHQASLQSLLTSSESGTGSSTGDSLSEARVMQEILAEGLLDGIDVDAINGLTEAEQTALAETIAEAYRQRRRERNQRNNPPTDNAAPPASVTNEQSSSNSLQVQDGRRHRRSSSGSRVHRADTMPSPGNEQTIPERPRSARTQPLDGSTATPLPPVTSVFFTHRRRTSSQDLQREMSRNGSGRSSPGTRSIDSRAGSTTDLAARSSSRDRTFVRRGTGSNVNQQTGLEARISPRASPRVSHAQMQPRGESSRPPAAAEVLPEVATNLSQQSGNSPRQHVSQLATAGERVQRPTVQSSASSKGLPPRRSSSLFDEPSVSCYRCHRADIQYDLHRHCDKCKLDLCLRCYRIGRGCKHWYGFGHAAMRQFEAMQPASADQVELPHTLVIGRAYKRPDDQAIVKSKIAKDGTTIIPLQTTSNPDHRMQEGRFCDRCNNFADALFWSCDYCNFGEWGFCSDCVNTHHCCTHPLSPSAHRSCVPTPTDPRPALEDINPTASELLTANLRPSPATSQPSSAVSATSALAGPLPNYIHMVVPADCDNCGQRIPPEAYRFHCPFHPSPSVSKPDAQGNYDICTTCYQNLIKTNHIKRDDGSAGWRKCPSGHRMIITAFQTDDDGDQRRIVINDLVGGWKTQDEATKDWNRELEARRAQGPPDAPASPDGSTARRLIRARTGSYPADPLSSNGASPFNSSSRFPPDGGTGLRGVAWYSFFPDDTDKGPRDLVFPSGAEILEIRIDDEYPDWCGGVYAGDRGLLPASYVRI